MKYVFCFISIFIFTISVQAQQSGQLQTAHWFFGGNAGLDFSSGSPVVDTNGQISTIEGSTSISDEYGNLLFYTDGRRIYNSTHNVMENGTGLHGDASSTSSAIVLPKPDDCNLYYVFTVDLDADKVPVYRPQRGIEYNVIDMSLNGGLGEVIEKNISVPINGVVQGYEKLTAISNADKTGYWIITHFEGNFYAFSVTAEGVNLTPVISPSTIFGGVNNIGYLKGSPNGLKLAMGMSFALPEEEDKSLSVYDFDNATGLVTDEVLLHYPNMLSIPYKHHFYGIEFSPNSQILYASSKKIPVDSSQDKICEILQYDLSAPNIIDSKYTIDMQGLCYGGALQLGVDGKIYANTHENEANGHYIAVIENPNTRYNPVVSDIPVFTTEFLDFGNISTGIGLPTFLNHYFRIAITVNDLSISEEHLYCAGELLDFNFCSQGGEIQSILWDFGDGSSSAEFYPQYAYNTTGIHTITLTLMVDEEEYIRTFDITITGPPDIADALLEACDIGEAQNFNLLDAMPQINPSNSGAIINFHQTENEANTNENPLSNSVTINATTIVYVSAVDTNGCYVVRELELVIHPLPILEVQAPVETCYGTSASLSVNADANNTVNWYSSLDGTVPVFTGNPFETPVLTSTTSYWIEAVSENGCVSARIETTIIVPEIEPPYFNLESIYCLNAYSEPLPSISENGISGSWSPAVVDTSVLGTQPYIFTSNTGECSEAYELTWDIEVIEIITPEFNLITEYCMGDAIAALPTISDNGIQGGWYPSQIQHNANGPVLYTFTPSPDQCAEVFQTEIKVIYYPKFFTPNGDGVNEYWNIYSLQVQRDALIKIFNRYGKLLTTIRPQGSGWDGTYNGKQLPSSDYWFVLTYIDCEGLPSEFRAHFSLKR